ncbi:unnamed protein product [Linum trigynum]|uniref:Uncharacterized protein n=1 Tax=Linum trigynum TaxID=586398 RepID=A0AAV2C7N1_9ROSI
MACIEHGVIIYILVCLVSQEEVIKVVFQSLKVATSKLENCQNLELRSRIMDEIRVQRIIPHESRYVLLQRHGIG